jgi:glycerol uptake facilitator-like aquaporin
MLLHDAFTGTFLFVCIIGCAVVTNPGQAPFAIGFALMAIVFAFGYFSGGHFNPAVTLGVLLIGGMSRKKAGTYAAVQFLAGILGSFYAVLVHGQLGAGFVAPMPSNKSTFGVLRAIAAEVLVTFFLVTVVLQVCVLCVVGTRICTLMITCHAFLLPSFCSAMCRWRAQGKKKTNSTALPSA